MITIPARQLLPGDVFDIGAEAVHVRHVHQDGRTHVHILCGVGITPSDDPALVAKLVLPAEASLIVTRHTCRSAAA